MARIRGDTSGVAVLQLGSKRKPSRPAQVQEEGASTAARGGAAREAPWVDGRSWSAPGGG